MKIPENLIELEPAVLRDLLVVLRDEEQGQDVSLVNLTGAERALRARAATAKGRLGSATGRGLSPGRTRFR
ncbi:MAG: hypothetical protein RL367_533 [Pseudomonadota bacterium]|jgi:hypothetical protein